MLQALWELIEEHMAGLQAQGGVACLDKGPVVGTGFWGNVRRPVLLERLVVLGLIGYADGNVKSL